MVGLRGGDGHGGRGGRVDSRRLVLGSAQSRDALKPRKTRDTVCALSLQRCRRGIVGVPARRGQVAAMTVLDSDCREGRERGCCTGRSAAASRVSGLPAQWLVAPRRDRRDYSRHVRRIRGRRRGRQVEKDWVGWSLSLRHDCASD
jgi:hypothetical protein